MIISSKPGYSYKDLTLVPATISDITSRKDCNPYTEHGNLPIFAAPMLSVVNEHNMKIFEKNNILPIAPRTVQYTTRVDYMNNGNWVALSLSEFKKLFVTNATKRKKNTVYRICVDLANGHMRSLFDVINTAKELAENNNYTLIIMTGNIANPATYAWICENAQVDYIRLGIGTGAGCLTTSNTGTHYPIATLIDECKKIQDEYKQGCIDANHPLKYKSIPYLIADGGIRNYDDVIKALGLGADYVMIGSVLASLLESAAEMTIDTFSSKLPATFDKSSGFVDYATDFRTIKHVDIWFDADEEDKRDLIRSVQKITKRYIGMSTKEAQKAVNIALETPVQNPSLKTSEGCTKFLECKYTISQWVENMTDYLRSAMSYANATTIKEFRNKANFIINSFGEIMAVNK